MRQIVLTVAEAEVELASDVLWSLGAVAVEERRADGMVELWTSIDGDVPDDLGWPWRAETVDDSVADNWRDHAVTTWINERLAVCPAWRSEEVPDDVTRVLIEPGPTFGMGDHPTTRLTLAAAARLMTPGCTVLDVGCGSGVLAVGCMMLGAGSAKGVDISPSAVPVTEANAALNGVHVDVSTVPLHDVEGQFDLVLANILAPDLVAMAADLRRVLADDGHLVISGILAERHDHVLRSLAPLQVVATDHDGPWCAVVLRHAQ